jgi:hypothetical protein
MQSIHRPVVAVGRRRQGRQVDLDAAVGRGHLVVDPVDRLDSGIHRTPQDGGQAEDGAEDVEPGREQQRQSCEPQVHAFSVSGASTAARRSGDVSATSA